MFPWQDVVGGYTAAGNEFWRVMYVYTVAYSQTRISPLAVLHIYII